MEKAWECDQDTITKHVISKSSEDLHNGSLYVYIYSLLLHALGVGAVWIFSSGLCLVNLQWTNCGCDWSVRYLI